MTASQLPIILSDYAKRIAERIDDILPTVNCTRVGEARLLEAMRYCALSEGKRLRPFLVVESSRLFGVSEESALRVGVAIELIHAFSLVHDDLPALDDDDVRRGKPSCHKQFDEATAILTGDALLTFAFEILADLRTHPDASVRSELVLACARATGVRGMIGGQMIDLIAEEKELTIEEITRLQRMKTGALFALSCEMGAVLGRASDSARKALRGYANDIGLAFQITDDLLDAEIDMKQDVERNNKSAEKGTYVRVMGVDKARQQATLLCEQAISHLESFDKRANNLKELARFVVNRNH